MIFAAHHKKDQVTVYMYIFAIAWLFVMAMLAITSSSLTAGILTFALWGVVPVLLLTWTFGHWRGAQRRSGRVQQTADESEAEKPENEQSRSEHL
jgi:ABC-type multidrug transport system fused ATPase/permease subunit